MKPSGYITIASPGARTVEIDTFTCAHCQYIVEVKPLSSPSAMGGWCARCNKCICRACANSGSCLPWEKQMERMEARDRFLRSVGAIVAAWMMCGFTVSAVALPMLGPADQIQFDYRTSDFTSGAITHFTAQWDNQLAVSIGVPTPFMTTFTTQGSQSYRVGTPFTAGTHAVVFRACNASGCGAASPSFGFRAKRGK